MKQIFSLFFLLIFACAQDSPDKSNGEASGLDNKTGTSDRKCLEEHPSDQKIAQDLDEYYVDNSIEYKLEATEPEWIVHPDYKILPNEIEIMPSNNNVEIIYHDERLYMAWRSSKTHFASDKAKLFLMSSKDMGKTWDFEKEHAIGADLREPRFLSIKGRLFLYVVELGVNATAFEPKKSWVAERKQDGSWTDLETFIEEPEVIWDMKIRNGKAYMSSYIGAHYDFKNEVQIKVVLRESEDGITWKKSNNKDSVYTGGCK